MTGSYYIGLMSGTSMDAIDAVLVDIQDGVPRTLLTHSTAYPPALRDRLLSAVSNDATPDEIGHLDRLTGEAFAGCALGLIQKAGDIGRQIRAIGSHGQTLRHAPDGPSGFSLQIGDPNVIAERTGITTVADFRRRDIAAGGQGAPLVPAFHSIVFGSAEEDRAVLNLGGIANVTIIPRRRALDSGAGQISGFDTGPASTLMDNWCQRHLNKAYDEDGNWARSGHIDAALLNTLLGDPYFSRCPPKSTGREYFHLPWLERGLAQHSLMAAEDVQRTLLELTAVSITRALAPHLVKNLFLCGGGAFNGFLLERLRALMPDTDIATTEVLGIDPIAVEGAAFAWLARQTLEGLPGNAPASTGASGPRVLGAIYPGRYPGR